MFSELIALLSGFPVHRFIPYRAFVPFFILLTETSFEFIARRSGFPEEVQFLFVFNSSCRLGSFRYRDTVVGYSQRRKPVAVKQFPWVRNGMISMRFCVRHSLE